MAGSPDVDKTPTMKSQDELNEEISFYVSLLCTLYSDVVSAFPAHSSVEMMRDLDCIQKRVVSEGIAFLTKTLPSLGKAIDKALALGTPLRVHAFARRRGSQVPHFMGWLIERVFHADGNERADACPFALQAIRQLTLAFYKLELPYSREVEDTVLTTFELTDSSLLDPVHLDGETKWVMAQAQRLIARVLANANPLDIVPKHGPGSVSTGERPSQKPHFKRFYERLDHVYSYTEYFYYNHTHVCDCSSGGGGLDRLDTLQTGTAKVVLVPKDSRGPRLISMEPLEYQWIQQGQMRLMVDTIESHWMTRGHVNFTDQTINQELAMLASQGHLPLCTMDMKDASDRVSLQLVQCLFPVNWVEALEASRSSGTMLPSGRIVPLNKFAPMGSAVCFPVEALCFWALSVAYQLKTRTLADSLASTYVYGDDILVPTKDYVGLAALYHKLHLRVSPDKCCIGSSFRESCGVDAFKGINVTPIRFKRRWTRRLMVGAVDTWCSLSNELWNRGLMKTAEFIRESVVEQLPIPTAKWSRGGCVFIRPTAHVRERRCKRRVLRFCRETHTLQARTLVPVPAVEYVEPGWEVLLDLHNRAHRHLTSDREVAPAWSFILHAGPPRAVAGCYPVPHSGSHKWGWTEVSF